MGAIGDAIKDLATAQDGTNLTDIWKDAQLAGADYKDVVLGIASSNPREIDKVIKKLGELDKAHDAPKATVAGYASLANQKADEVRDANGRLIEKLKDVAEKSKDAGKAQELAAKAGLTDFALKQGAIDQVAGAWRDAAGDVDDYIDKESGLFDTGKYIKAMERRQKALEDYAETLEKSDISPEAKAYIESLGEDQAAALMSGYKHTTKANQEKLDEIWTAAGNKSADSYGDALGSSLGDRTVRGPRVKVPALDIPSIITDAQNYLDNRPLFFRTRVAAPSSIAKPVR
jgi:tetratricopeptide (TPR) repeat protein